ncbi:MAG: ABC1 kinase family protein [Gammaproteobacteria bacterium]
MGAPPTGKLARGAIGGVALAQAGMARIGHGARKLTRAAEEEEAAQLRFEADLGRILFKALNQLKGTALKVSQALSTHADFLPAGIRSELAKGCHRVTPLNRALVQKVFRSEFGQGPESLFASFDAQAFAAASLGQVHHATLADGRAVAVKVQYPGIGASIKSDLAMLRGLLQTLGAGLVHLPRRELVDQMMFEVAGKLEEELDYHHEAAELAWYHARVPAARYAVPRPVSSHSSARVLTMERLDGLHLDDWLARGPDQASRDAFGQLLFDWFHFSVHELERVNADPHEGNFLFMPDGRLGLLDFGCTRALAPGFPALLRRAWNAVLNRPVTGAQTAARQAYLDLQLISPDLTQEQFDTLLMPTLAPMVDWQLAPFQAKRFDFASWAPMPMASREQTRVLAQLMAGVHPDLPYVDRAYAGIMQMLKKMGAVVSTENAWVGRA